MSLLQSLTIFTQSTPKGLKRRFKARGSKKEWLKGRLSLTLDLYSTHVKVFIASLDSHSNDQQHVIQQTFEPSMDSKWFNKNNTSMEKKQPHTTTNSQKTGQNSDNVENVWKCQPWMMIETEVHGCNALATRSYSGSLARLWDQTCRFHGI